MDWMDIAGIVFACVTANHLGLISAIEGVVGRKMPIVNCPKCLTFWVTVGTVGAVGDVGIVTVLAVSFLASYSAVWLELLEGYIDTLYMKCYEKIYPNATNDTPAAADTDDDDSAGTVSAM